MEEDTEVLDEVVVVGYGAQKKESVVGAISQVSSKELLKSPAANISQAIAGKISGVITSQTSGAPGADDMKIYIRGRASFAGDNQPLILVDGVEREFSQIAPDDIESISTLKDASATAVYGVRGANGVMLITTKRGKEQKPTVSLTANWQIQSPTRQDTYLDSYNSVVLLEEALANDGLPSQYSASDIEMYKRASAGQLSGIDALLYPNVDWYDTVLRNSAPAQRQYTGRYQTYALLYFCRILQPTGIVQGIQSGRIRKQVELKLQAFRFPCQSRLSDDQRPDSFSQLRNTFRRTQRTELE